MSLRPETFICLGCGIEKRYHYSSFGKFCSNACQREYTTSNLDRLFTAGEPDIYKTNASRRKALTRIRGHKCQTCGIENWNNKPIILELEHIDGNYNNNIITNLELICPNCHSQTDTYKNKNKGHGRPWRRKSAE
jgi:hypothetical protein